MTPVLKSPPKNKLPWTGIAWFGALLVACYMPVLQQACPPVELRPRHGPRVLRPGDRGLYRLAAPRASLAAIKPQPNWWGLLVIAWGGIQLLIATLGAELFTARMSFVVTIIGVVWTLGGT